MRNILFIAVFWVSLGQATDEGHPYYDCKLELTAGRNSSVAFWAELDGEPRYGTEDQPIAGALELLDLPTPENIAHRADFESEFMYHDHQARMAVVGKGVRRGTVFLVRSGYEPHRRHPVVFTSVDHTKPVQENFRVRASFSPEFEHALSELAGEIKTLGGYLTYRNGVAIWMRPLIGYADMPLPAMHDFRESGTFKQMPSKTPPVRYSYTSLGNGLLDSGTLQTKVKVFLDQFGKNLKDREQNVRVFFERLEDDSPKESKDEGAFPLEIYTLEIQCDDGRFYVFELRMEKIED